MTFTIEVEQEDDGRWIAEIAQIPGAMVYGRTREEAVSRVEALESRLDAGTNLRNGKAARPKWMRAYGALRHLRHARKAIERAIESEFETIERKKVK
jgi:hypothetical protein